MSRTPRVLVVDDSESIATSLTSILNKNEFQAVAAFSSADALKLAQAKPFDILLTDVMMAPLNGVQTGIAFRNINPASHVFLITGTYEVARQLLVKANLAWDFHILQKPIHPEELLEVLRSAWTAEVDGQPRFNAPVHSSSSHSRSISK